MKKINKVDISKIFSQKYSNQENLQRLCDQLNSEIDYYDWVGFYIVNFDTKVLELGPYAGAPTEHTEIAFGKGVCGESVKRKDSIIVPDVNKLNNYLACSLHVKSEIVVPVFKAGKYVAQIDIDSHILDAFSKKDEEFLRNVCDQAASFFPLNCII